MACKLCSWLCNWLCADGDPVEALRKDARSWERDYSNDYELWSEASEEDRGQLETALAVQEADPETAFRIYLDVAERMAWAMELVASHYERGVIVAADFDQAREYYRRAIVAGSWMATIGYAKLLVRHGDFDAAEALLRDGVERGFVPACVWLARLRLDQSTSRETCREIRSLLERAAEVGHPEADLMLGRLQLRGKYGLREIPVGLKRLMNVSKRDTADASSQPDIAVMPAQAGIS